MALTYAASAEKHCCSKLQNTLLEQRIQRIRKQNEKLRKRHLEVEADKENAAKLCALVSVRSEQKRLQQQNNGRHGGSAKCRALRERNGPPPDPAYNFLADPERDPDRRSQRQPQWREKSYGRNRGASTRDKGKWSSPQQAARRNAHQAEHEAWKAERKRIERKRISRQRTADSHWRREWDKDKITQEEKHARQVNMSRGGVFRRQYDWHPSSHKPYHRSERGGRSHGRGNYQGKQYFRAPGHPSRGRAGPRQNLRATCSSQCQGEADKTPPPPQQQQKQTVTTVEAVTVEDVTVEDVTVEDVTVEAVTVEDVTVGDVTVEAVTVEDVTVEAVTVEDVTAKLGHLMINGQMSLQPVPLVPQVKRYSKTVTRNTHI